MFWFGEISRFIYCRKLSGNYCDILQQCMVNILANRDIDSFAIKITGDSTLSFYSIYNKYKVVSKLVTLNNSSTKKVCLRVYKKAT